MTETWCKDMTFDTFSVNGYQHIHDYRKERTGSGVSLFIKNGIEYVNRDDLSVFNNDIESLFIDVANMKSASRRATVVGVIYRQPDQDINEFSITMSTILANWNQRKSYPPIRGLQYQSVEYWQTCANCWTFRHDVFLCYVPLYRQAYRMYKTKCHVDW